MSKKVLACDGGGVCGVIFAQILKRIQDDLLNEPIGKHLDYICGVSVGSIISAYIATTSPDKMVDFDRVLRKDFFTKAFAKRVASNWIPFSNLCLTGYKQRDKTNFLKSAFADYSMGECYIPFGALAYNVSECRAKVFASTNETDKQLPVYLVCNASSSAPTYFNPVRIYGNDYLDGAMVSNNASLTALLCSFKHFGEKDLKDNNIKILSIGYSQDIEYSENASNLFKGSIYWITDNRIIDILIDASSDLNNFACQTLLKDRYLRIAGRIDRIKLDQLDDETIRECRILGNQWYEKNKIALYDFFEIEKPGSLGETTQPSTIPDS